MTSNDRGQEMQHSTIRISTANDVDAIAALTRAAYAKWVPLIGREPLPMKVDYAAAFKVHRFDLLHEGQVLAGLIETVPQDSYLLIENLAVHPEYQRRGHGRTLLAHVEDLASSTGLSGTRLYTNSRFVENVRLYARLGYQVEREEVLEGGVAVHMLKRLA